MCRQLGDNIRFQLYLLSGDVVDVVRVDVVRDGYVLLTVLPSDGVHAGSIASRMQDGQDKIQFDRMAIPYSQISRILLTTTQFVAPPKRLVSFKPSNLNS